jgi:YHS domain-containing protein
MRNDTDVSDLDDGRITFGSADEPMNLAEKDPVCGMDVFPATAASKSAYRGNTYHFCSDTCRNTFDDDPPHYVG